MDLVTKVAAAIKKELKKQGPSGPEGLPVQRDNRDVTDPDYPTAHNEPRDHGFTGPTIIAGTGSGPAEGDEMQQHTSV